MNDTMPRYAIMKGRGKVRILEYRPGTQTFVVLTNKDERVWTKRSQLTFIKEKKIK